MKLAVKLLLLTAVVTAIAWLYLMQEDYPEHIRYGASFNTFYAEDLGLDWEEVYTAMLEDLGVKHLRLSAHWPMVEPEKGNFNFHEIDRQLELAEQHNATVIIAVGRRLPRWPECHVPEWVRGKVWEEEKEFLRQYITQVVTRYKDNKTVKYWQIENEPFLAVYAREQCGELDKNFLDEELTLVKKLDPTRPIIVTDSGNLGTWFGAYRRGDVFGTSVYVYLWNEATGPIETVLPPETYLAKRRVMEILFGKKENILIELSVEPWLGTPIQETDTSLQLERMDIEKFETILEYAAKTRFDTQYLWGVEWWYWLKEKKEHPEFWQRARTLYTEHAIDNTY